MTLNFADFWKLAAESRLLTSQQCQQLHHDFSQVKGAVETGSAKTLAEWLVSRNVISRYQATILLAGRAGPFVYGDYRVYERIDAGRLNGWFRAVHGPTGHPVLLEFLTGSTTSDPRQWVAAANEAVANCAIVSPYLQRWHDVVDLTSFKFVVSEDLRGQTAEEKMASGRLPPQEACRLIVQAALGLAQLHQSGRVHGDVRPGNFWVEPAQNHPGHFKLLRDPLYIPQPLLVGSADSHGKLALLADYLAPEFLQSGKLPDPLTDIYALGCTFYCLLAGSPPFAGGTTEQKLSRHASEPIRPLEQFGVPQPIAQLVAYLMAKNPTVRYQQAAIVAEQLAPFVDPQVLYLPPANSLPTVAAYDAWIKQKQAVLAAKAAVPTPPVAPAMGVAVAPNGGNGGTNAPPLVNDFSNLVDAKKPKKSVSPDVVKSKSPDASSKLVTPDSEAAKTKKVVTALVITGVLAILALIIINVSSRPTKPQGETVAENENPPEENTNPVDTNPPKSTTQTPTTNVTTKTPSTPPKEEVKPTPPTKGPTTPQPVAVDVGLTQNIVADDGKMLWASPTAGKPLELRGVPAEGQLFIALRAADFTASAEGTRVLAALGPEFAAQQSKWEAAAGFKLAEIERLVLTFHNNDGRFPRVSVVVYPKGNPTADTLREKWGNGLMEQKEGNDTYYTGNGWSYYIPAFADHGTFFVMGDEEAIKEVAKSHAAPPVLRKEVERLRRATDADRHVNVLFYPNFLANNDGEPLFAGDRMRGRAPLLWLLGDDLQAGSLSVHCAAEFYWEVRLLSSLSKEKSILASEFRDRLQTVPVSIRKYIAAMNPPEYWKEFAFMFPGMITQLHAQTRVGVEEESAVVNCILPAVAAHNLVLGTELSLATAPGAGGTAVAVKPTGPKANIKTIDDVLGVKTSFSFDQTSLEFAMRDLGNEAADLAKGTPVNFAIRILGDDLKLDGITRNMSIRDFKQEQKTVGEILTALVMKANPITTVKDPSEKDQKLLWVVGPDPDDPTKTIVLITTRQKAEERKYNLPAPFSGKKT